MPTACEVSDDAGVLVIRMRTEYKQAAERVQPFEKRLKPRRAAETRLLSLKRDKQKQSRQQEAKQAIAETRAECHRGCVILQGRAAAAALVSDTTAGSASEGDPSGAKNAGPAQPSASAAS